MKLTKTIIVRLLFGLLAFFCILNLPAFLYYKGYLSFKVIPLGLSIFLLLLLPKYAKVIYELKLYLFFLTVYLLIGLLSVVLKNAVTNIDIANSVRDIIINIIILIAAYQYATCTSETEYSKALKIIGLISVIGVLTIIFSTQLGLDNITEVNSEDYGRKSGVYLNPNIAGFCAVILISFAFANDFKNKTVNMVLFVAALLAVFMSASKTSFVILAVFVVVFLSKYKIKNINMKSVISVIVISVLAYILLQDFLVGDNYDRIMQLAKLAHGNTSSDVTSGRLDLARAAIGIISDNILMGEGLYYFTLLPADITGLGYDLGVHNTYLLVLGDSGFLPFLLFLFMLVSCIKASYKYSSNHFMCYFFVAYAFFASVNHNLFDSSFVSFFLGFSLASLARLNNNEQLQLND